MRRFVRLVAGVLLGGSVLGAQGALAQQPVSVTVDGTTISVGGGGQFLSLPDIKFTGAGKPGVTRIDDDGAFATRTILRLNIGLGPTTLYSAAPVYNEPIE